MTAAPPAPARQLSRALAGVLAVLVTTGWAANHFAAMIPVLREHEGLSHALLDGVFGIYALGLLPGLVGGGALSDRVGRAAVVLPGATIALAGTVLLLVRHDAAGLVAGRLVVGIGAGLAIGAGTAWATDLRGKVGTVLAGVALSSGFALGPIVSGLLAEFGPRPLSLPFVLSAALSAAAVAAAAVWSRSAHYAAADLQPVVPGHGRSVAAALSWSLPLAPWVFACVTVAFVTFPARVSSEYAGPALTGAAALLALGSGIVVQAAARRREWGPRAGTVGAVLAGLGFLLVGAGGTHPPLWLLPVAAPVLGVAYGLCLREGLLDLESLAPKTARGTLTGVFYVGTYLGFALPVLLVVLEPVTGASLPLFALAVPAFVVAVVRARRLVVAEHPRTADVPHG